MTVLSGIINYYPRLKNTLILDVLLTLDDKNNNVYGGDF